MFDALLSTLETDLRTAFDVSLTGLVATARTQLDAALVKVAKERAKGLADVAKEKQDLHREIAAMHKHKEAQEGHVVLNIGGYRYETSVQTLRRLPHTFFDAYFSGRYAQDVCADGSIFIDRDGEHFGQVLEYLRDGVVSVAERDASKLDIGMLRWLRREFGFYCIELMAEQQEVAYVVGGADANNTPKATMERYDADHGVWREAAPMATGRTNFVLCTLHGALYSVGGTGAGALYLASVERYDPSLNSWSAAPPMFRARCCHCAVSVGDAIFVIGGMEKSDGRVRVLGSMLKFDSRTQGWSEVAPMPEHRAYAGACVLESNIYVFGGKGPGNRDTATAYCYDPVTDAWVTLAPMPEAKRFNSVCVIGGLIYVLGGQNVVAPSSSAHSFDPVAKSWSAVAPMSTARSACASFVLNGSIYVAGGHDGRQLLASVERYDVISNTWSVVCAMNQARGGFAAHAMVVEIDLFDSLMLKAKVAQRLN
jgi:influenza virus NS1A-binding protein